MAAARGQGILDAADRLAELVPIEETLAAYAELTCRRHRTMAVAGPVTS